MPRFFGNLHLDIAYRMHGTYEDLEHGMNRENCTRALLLDSGRRDSHHFSAHCFPGQHL